MCQQKEKVQYTILRLEIVFISMIIKIKTKNLQSIHTNYKDKYLYTVLSRKVEGLGPTKPWQPTHFGKGATSFSNPVRDR